jgi:choline dehydrogenase-like flavoprotein
MLIDARAVEGDVVVEAQVCVVGSGPAGIALTRTLAQAGIQVALIESGGLEFDQQAQALNAGEGGPIRTYTRRELDERRRQFGGLANIWDVRTGDAGGLARFVLPDRLDFEARAGVPRSGWPFGRTHLDPYYVRAYELLGISPEFISQSLIHGDDAVPLPFSGGRIATRVSPYGNGKKFLNDVGHAVLDDERVQVVVGATGRLLETDRSGERVAALRATTANRRDLRVRASTFVLATGGIENARLLLASDATVRGGLGNRHDLVGRCFMEHPFLAFGVLEPAEQTLFNRLRLYDLHAAGGTMVMGGLGVEEEVRREERLLGACAFLVPRHASYASAGVRSLLTIVPRLRAPSFPVGLPGHFLHLLADSPSVAKFVALRMRRAEYQHLENHGGWSMYPPNANRYGAIALTGLVEQVPDPRNRVQLSTQRDHLGMPRARLDLRWSSTDVDSVTRTCRILAEDVARSRLGRFTAWDPLTPRGLPMYSPCHHLGTTRMDDDPRSGVVDRNCRVHGVGNLFVAGSSVFPTGAGWANPTLTIIALALRLGDHLASDGAPDQAAFR